MKNDHKAQPNNMIYLINGPNLNMLGYRESQYYGTTSLKEIENSCETVCGENGFSLRCLQSNHEGQLIDWIQEAHQSPSVKGILINAGALSHTSLALHDALKMLTIPIVEVHLSNIYKRELVRHHSYVSQVATGVVVGFTDNSYVLGLNGLLSLLTAQH